ncbi:hypothetical protein ACFPM7_18085 [Actinokineospora guangxiensis]|uniref:Uncharacterized protein n=1 Tax=Actinokineospora guangxiensis TaxID=1490288 RepID=A0ABW0ESV3_9PSEU
MPDRPAVAQGGYAVPHARARFPTARAGGMLGSATIGFSGRRGRDVELGGWWEKVAETLPRKDGVEAGPPDDRGALRGAVELFLRAGVTEVEHQLDRTGRANKDCFGLGEISRERILKQARRVQAELRPGHDWGAIPIGRGAFNYRWPTMLDYNRSLVIYCLYAPRWRAALEQPARIFGKHLPEVAAGTMRLFALIDTAASVDVKLRIRFAKFQVFQLGLGIDGNWADIARAANVDFQLDHTRRWVDRYDEAVRLLGVRYRPGWSGLRLHGLIAPLAMGIGLSVSTGGGDQDRYDASGEHRLTEGIKAFAQRAIDPGDRVDLFAE